MRSVVNTTLRVDEDETPNNISSSSDTTALPEKFFISGKTVLFGENISLECPVYGFPMPKIEWKKDNGETLDVSFSFFFNF